MTQQRYKSQTDRQNLLRDLMRLDQDRMIDRLTQDIIPPEWHTLTWDIETRPKKQKITLYIDQAVAKFFQSMGTGFQTRINHLLATYMKLQCQQFLDLEKYLKERVGKNE